MPWRPRKTRARTDARGLGLHWRRIRDLAVALEPWCHNTRCQTPVSANNPLTGEHRIPREQGGQLTAANTTPLCLSCNSRHLGPGTPLAPATIERIEAELQR